MLNHIQVNNFSIDLVLVVQKSKKTRWYNIGTVIINANACAALVTLKVHMTWFVTVVSRL